MKKYKNQILLLKEEVLKLKEENKKISDNNKGLKQNLEEKENQLTEFEIVLGHLNSENVRLKRYTHIAMERLSPEKLEEVTNYLKLEEIINGGKQL